MMKKEISIAALILSIVGCSSAPKSEAPPAPVTKAPVAKVVSDAPEEIGDANLPEQTMEVKEEAARPTAPAASGLYASLDEGIKEQSDEKIYQSATQILAQSSNDLRALNALAMYHYKRGRYDLCRYLLNKGISASPKTAELYSNLGVVQLAQGEQREAVKSFRKALEINSRDSVAAANLGAIYTRERDFGKASIVLEIAYGAGIRDPRVLNNYAITLTAQKKYEKAAEIYKVLLKENSSNREYLFNYAILLVDEMGKFQEGLDVINRLKFVGGPADSRNRIIALENKAKAGLQ